MQQTNIDFLEFLNGKMKQHNDSGYKYGSS
jgi:hypothetical protein